MAETDYSTIPTPYDDLLKRAETTSTDNVDGVASNMSGSDSSGNTEKMPVKSDGSVGDIWISSFIKSQNYKPKAQGFMIDGPRGYFEGADVWLSGTITATSGKLGSSTNYWNIGASGLTAIAQTGDVIINYGKTDFGQDSTNGFILGYDYSSSTPKFEIGSSSLKMFKYDGTDLSLVGCSISIGTGDNVFKADSNGIYLGSADFATAPFKVDMAGNMTTTSISFLWSDISGPGKPQDYATVGATWNSNISGQPSDASITNPSYIKSTYIDSTSITSPTITGGIITGATLRTASSGQRIQISGSTNDMVFYNSNGTNVGSIQGLYSAGGQTGSLLVFDSSQYLLFTIGGGLRAYFNSSGMAISGSLGVTGNITASNFSGSSSGSNTGDSSGHSGLATTSQLSGYAALSGASFYGTIYADILPYNSSSQVGYAGNRFNVMYTARIGNSSNKVIVYCNGLTACPLPITVSALGKLRGTTHKKLGKGKGHYGDNLDYLDISDAPSEMKAIFGGHEDPDGSYEEEHEDIDIIKTVAFLYSSLKELSEEVLEIKDQLKKTQPMS